jgi:hypothetical protein
MLPVDWQWKHINILSGKTQWIGSGSILTYYLVKHSGLAVENVGPECFL